MLPFIPKVLNDSMGHSLIVGQLSSGGCIMACSKCGAWAVNKPKGILHACAGKFSNKATRREYHRITVRRIHPKDVNVQVMALRRFDLVSGLSHLMAVY